MTAPVKLATVSELLGDRYTADMREAFPDVTPEYIPFGYNVLAQLCMPKRKIGSIYIPDSEKDAERYRVQAMLIRGLGPAAFANRETLIPWPEGAWVKPGDFARGPLWGGDRFNLKFEPGNGQPKDHVTFVFFKDSDLIASFNGDPLSVITS